ncbi:MAG: putative exported protein [Cenarchaeum symbiont of Oopsacas minuta]|nr:putative exported protein [Cenarchaeum symbiont of Oopsacas minuta]
MQKGIFNISIVILTLSIIFSMPIASAQESTVDQLTIEVDEEIYVYGNEIMVTIVLQEHSDPKNGVGILITGGVNNSVVHIDQINEITPKSSETVIIQASGYRWLESGIYTITANYGSVSASDEFEFIPKNVSPTEEEVMIEEEIVVEEEEVMIEEEEIVVEEEEVMIEEEEIVPPPQMTCAAGEIKKGDECVSICGDGTQFIDGQCTTICGSGTEWDGTRCIASLEDTTGMKEPGGCLIATAAYGTELAPQIQTLREIRDNTLMETSFGTSFMSGFNTIYYTFSPTIADWERQNPAFASTVGAFLTPMISTLNIMSLAEDTDTSVLALGISVIALNLGIYIGTPVGVTYGIRKIIKRSSA